MRSSLDVAGKSGADIKGGHQSVAVIVSPRCTNTDDRGCSSKL